MVKDTEKRNIRGSRWPHYFEHTSSHLLDWEMHLRGTTVEWQDAHSFKVPLHKFLVEYKRKNKREKNLREICQKIQLYKRDQRECHPQWDNPCHALPQAILPHGDAGQLHTCVVSDPERQTAQVQRHSPNYVVFALYKYQGHKNDKIKAEEHKERGKHNFLIDMCDPRP